MDSEEGIGCLILAVFMVLLIIGSIIWSPISCSARWGDFETSWGPIKGCTVKQGNKFYPEDRVRSVE